MKMRYPKKQVKNWGGSRIVNVPEFNLGDRVYVLSEDEFKKFREKVLENGDMD